MALEQERATIEAIIREMTGEEGAEGWVVRLRQWWNSGRAALMRGDLGTAMGKFTEARPAVAGPTR